MSFTAKEMTELRKLQAQLLKGFTYQYDEDKHKVFEFWEDVIPKSGVIPANTRFSGDCEEFAMHALQRSQQLGFNARLVFCYVGKDAHCICEVLSKDQKASVMLDNRYDRPMVRADMRNYRFFAVGPINPVRGETRPWKLVA